MKKYLVQFSSDWADEFQAEGLAILDENRVEQLMTWAASNPEWNFGTNEGFEGEDLSNCFTAREISAMEETVLIKLIPALESHNFGQFPYHIEYASEEN